MTYAIPSPPSGLLPPSADDIAELAERALASIPPHLAEHVRDVGVVVEERADDETLHELNVESPWELTGLYRGTPLTERSVMDPVRQPDRIFLYREAILLEWIETGEDLYRLVRNVVVHEVAHHFGFSDADIDAIEQDRDPENSTLPSSDRGVAIGMTRRPPRIPRTRAQGRQRFRLEPRVFPFPPGGAPGRMRQREIAWDMIPEGAHALRHWPFSQQMVQRVASDQQSQPDRGHRAQKPGLPQRRAFGTRRRVAAIG